MSPLARESLARVSIARAGSSLALSNVVVVATGLVTGPVLARTLGPAGRGLLASIIVPLGFASSVLALSLPEFVTRQTARGRATGDVLGSVLPLLVGAAIVGAVAFFPLSDILAGGRHEIRTYILVGAWLLPLAFLNVALIGVASGLQRWTLGAAAQAAPPLFLAAAVIILAFGGKLTLETAAVASIASPLVMLAPLIARLRRSITAVRFNAQTALQGLSYGGRAFLGVVAISVNARLDQLLMIRLASARELGLYAVAVTMASLTTLAGASLAAAIFPRVAAGEHALTQRASRIALLVALCLACVIAALAYPTLWFIFGPAFAAATPMVFVLLVAFTISSVNLVLAFALRSVGRPGIVSLAEVAAVLITVPGVLILVPHLGGVGAALATTGAYVAIFVTLFRAAKQSFDGGLRDYLIFRRSDASAVVTLLRASAAHLRRRLFPRPGRGVE